MPSARLRILVSTKPGVMLFTLIFFEAKSRAAPLIKPLIAPFDAEYADSPIVEMYVPDMDEKVSTDVYAMMLMVMMLLMLTLSHCAKKFEPLRKEVWCACHAPGPPIR